MVLTKDEYNEYLKEKGITEEDLIKDIDVTLMPEKRPIASETRVNV